MKGPGFNTSCKEISPLLGAVNVQSSRHSRNCVDDLRPPDRRAALFARSNRDDRDSENELQAIAVRVEKYQNSWRARHQTPDWEL